MANKDIIFSLLELDSEEIKNYFWYHDFSEIFDKTYERFEINFLEEIHKKNLTKLTTFDSQFLNQCFDDYFSTPRFKELIHNFLIKLGIKVSDYLNDNYQVIEMSIEMEIYYRNGCGDSCSTVENKNFVCINNRLNSEKIFNQINNEFFINKWSPKMLKDLKKFFKNIFDAKEKEKKEKKTLTKILIKDE